MWAQCAPDRGAERRGDAVGQFEVHGPEFIVAFNDGDLALVTQAPRQPLAGGALQRADAMNGSMPISVSRVRTLGASLVCRVVSTRWPVRAASIAICAVSWSRISPIRMMSGSARRMERRAAAKVQTRLGVHLHLIDARDSILDRILNGDDVDFRPDDSVQRRVQAGGLTRARGSADDEHAVGLLVRVLPVAEIGRREAEIG